MAAVLVHPARPPPAEFHATTDFDGLCSDGAGVSDLGVELPAPLHPARRLCLPLLVGVACVRCLTTTVATALDRRPHLSYGIAKEHHVLDFPHVHVPMPWPDHQRTPPTAEHYAAGFPLCPDELAFDFTPGLLSEKNPSSHAKLARKLLPPNPTLLIMVPEPADYVARRLRRGVDLFGQMRQGCATSSKENDCWMPSDILAWFRSCIGAPTSREQVVPPDCGRRLLTTVRGFASACPWSGLELWRKAGFEAKHFAFLPTHDVTSADPAKLESITLELAELMGAGVRFGVEALRGGVTPDVFDVHMNSSYGARGSVIYGAECKASAAERVQQTLDMDVEVAARLASGEQKAFITEPRRDTKLELTREDKVALRRIYDEHCGRPLADWLEVPLDRLYPPVEGMGHAGAPTEAIDAPARSPPEPLERGKGSDEL